MALLNVSYHSKCLGMDMQMNVILPEEVQEPWKTLYLLHGMGDDYAAWVRKANIERYAQENGMAIVMPGTHLGWYTDMYHGLKYFEHIACEVPTLCRRFFPGLSGRREDTFVAGISMGGYGAVKCALRAPETFCKAISLSGALDITKIQEKAQTTPYDGYWEDVFGPKEKIAGSFNDIMAAEEEMKNSPLRPDIWMWCGTEDFLYEMNVRMKEHLKKLNYHLVYNESSGDHEWLYWDAQIQRALKWLNGKEN